MCNPASFVVTRERAHWSKTTDSHEEIIAEHRLTDLAWGGRVNIVRTELRPPCHKNFSGYLDVSIPHDQWTFKIDQDVLPAWFSEVDVEKMCRDQLPKWCEARIFVTGEHKVFGSGMFFALGDAKIHACGSSFVIASGHANLTLSGSAYAYLVDEAQANATEEAHVEAHAMSRARVGGNASGEAWDCAHLLCTENAKCAAWDTSNVSVYHKGRAIAHDRGKVDIYGGSIVDLQDQSFGIARSCLPEDLKIRVGDNAFFESNVQVPHLEMLQTSSATIRAPAPDVKLHDRAILIVDRPVSLRAKFFGQSCLIIDRREDAYCINPTTPPQVYGMGGPIDILSIDAEGVVRFESGG